MRKAAMINIMIKRALIKVFTAIIQERDFLPKYIYLHVDHLYVSHSLLMSFPFLIYQ